MRSVKVKSGSKVVLSEYQGPVPEGKAFLAWATREDGTGVRYKPGQTITVTGDLRLYPVWGDSIQEATE